MKKLAFLFLLAVLLFTTLASAQCPSGCLFYGGDFDANNPNANGLGNENDAVVGGNPFGDATFQNFVSSRAWNITGLFTNNLSSISPSNGYWQLRSGMADGNAGTLIASGAQSGSNFSQTPTGRSGFDYTEYTDLATGLNVTLPPGMYWFAMVPECPTCEGRSYNTNSLEGLNSVGTQVSDQQFWISSFFDCVCNADQLGIFPTMSGGVLGTEVPEPSSLIMLASGLIAAAGLVRDRSRRAQ